MFWIIFLMTVWWSWWKKNVTPILEENLNYSPRKRETILYLSNGCIFIMRKALDNQSNESGYPKWKTKWSPMGRVSMSDIFRISPIKWQFSFYPGYFLISFVLIGIFIPFPFKYNFSQKSIFTNSDNIIILRTLILKLRILVIWIETVLKLSKYVSNNTYNVNTARIKRNNEKTK